MKYTQTILRFAVALCLAIVLLGVTLWINPWQAPRPSAQSGQGMALRPPAFLKAAYAQDSTSIDFGFILNEAGVTAYTKLDQELDLALLESRFKSIRQQTNQFISGIIVAPGYEKLTEFDENVEVQVFLHSDGWILAYLTRWQPASALFDWVNYDEKRLNGSTLTENVVRMLTADLGISNYNIYYYDFRYPKANNLMLVADRVDVEHSGESFSITVPRGLTIYDSSWSLGAFESGHNSSSSSSGCNINEEQLGTIRTPYSKWGLVSGELSKAIFKLDINHTLAVWLTGYPTNVTRAYCGLAIVYQEATQ
jgi:hypothetical protein